MDIFNDTLSPIGVFLGLFTLGVVGFFFWFLKKKPLDEETPVVLAPEVELPKEVRDNLSVAVAEVVTTPVKKGRKPKATKAATKPAGDKVKKARK